MKSIFYFIAFAFILTSCKSTATVTKKTERKEMKETQKLVDNIVYSAIENLGVRYKVAGTTKNGFDCSGLVFSTFSNYDILLPRTSFDQSKQGIYLGGNLKEARKGDLIFFRTNGKSQINHVGIVTEVDDDIVRFIHTSTSKGVIISSTNEPYYRKTFVQLNRILD